MQEKSVVSERTLSASPSPALRELFERHEEAYRIDDTAWNSVGDAEESPMNQARPPARVEVGRLILSIDNDGNKVTEPIYAGSEEKIREHFERHMSPLLSGSPKWAEHDDRIRCGYQVRLQAKLEEFYSVVEERQAIEKACGYTDALAAARATSDAVRHIEEAILGFVPKTLSDAAHKARWIVNAYNSGRSYLADDDKALERALDAIAAAA